LEETILPAIRGHRPDAILVSAGFDAWRNDPLGGLTWSRECFAMLGRRLRGVAEELCSGRMAAFLEGGYDLEALPGLVEAFLDGCEGTETR
ncbi:MAG: histone deacetylase, partial [Acidobacteria bacterium]|nr:histone deacetylase [Acidobacteriota bacterium]